MADAVTESSRATSPSPASTGIGALDDILGGGFTPNRLYVVEGVPGSGKTTLALRRTRPPADLQPHLDSGRVNIVPVDPAELSPGEFAHAIRRSVEDDHAAIIVIDSLNGYMNAMPDERFLNIQLHELLSFLGQRGVATMVISAQHGLIAANMTSPVDATYLADAAILLRYFEAMGEVTIREFRLDTGHIRVGEPLREFRGVLTGVPEYLGTVAPLMDKRPS